MGSACARREKSTWKLTRLYDSMPTCTLKQAIGVICTRSPTIRATVEVTTTLLKTKGCSSDRDYLKVRTIASCATSGRRTGPYHQMSHDSNEATDKDDVHGRHSSRAELCLSMLVVVNMISWLASRYHIDISRPDRLYKLFHFHFVNHRPHPCSPSGTHPPSSSNPSNCRRSSSRSYSPPPEPPDRP
jgi:hypothetical protein